MKTQKLSKPTRAGLVLSALSCLFWASSARAETTLVVKDGWTFFFDGRVNAFISYGFGDEFPVTSPDPNAPDPNATGNIVSNAIGWQSQLQGDANNKYNAIRVRSGFVGNILGFGVKKDVGYGTTAKSYIGVWSTVETLDRDKWQPNPADVREGYLKLEGPWGSVLAGRSLGLFGRGSTEINFNYGHNFGLGHPCSDRQGPGCGHIGTGVMFPGFSAGIVYSTPRLAGFQLSAGLYDPVRLLGGAWERAPWLRPEGQLAFDMPIGTIGKIGAFVEGVYQMLGRVDTDPDDDPATVGSGDETTAIWGAAGGVKAELGPVRLGLAAFYGPGLGFYYALQNSFAGLHRTTYELRTYDGYYGQGALVFGPVQVSLGAGVARLKLLSDDSTAPEPGTSLPKQQFGVSAGVFYHLSDNVVLGLDYFRVMASWYGAPALAPGVGRLPGEKQDLNFINAGVTFHW